MKLVPTIGIEVHVQFNTATKLFAAVSNDAVDVEPNTLVSPVCFGLPGSLPVLNEGAIERAIRAGLAMNAQVNLKSKFDRKHYYYPDLPLGYQITQLYEKIIGEGAIDIAVDGGTRTIRVESAHLEADAGKSSHTSAYSLVDLNRAGTPLLEIVSHPDMHSAVEAREYVKELYLLMKYADVSNVDLFRGNMRFDINISVAEDGASQLGTRTEIKNLNSFKAVEKATEYEIQRQIDIIEGGGTITQETRGWNDETLRTTSQRSKEDAHDYRYFPEPDIPPIVLSQEQVDAAKATMPILPPEIRTMLGEVGIEPSVIETLLEHKRLMLLVLDVLSFKDDKLSKKAVNWVVSDLLAHIGEDYDWDTFCLSATRLQELKALVDADELSSTGAKEVLMVLSHSDRSPRDIAEEKQLLQVSDTGAIEAIVDEVLAENQKAVDDIQSGNDGAIGFLVGQVMKKSQGAANPKVAQQLIREKL